MRKRILLWVTSILLLALLTGCTLARPEITDTAANSQGDTFCGFWLVYDRWENDDKHVFDVNSKTEQMLLAYAENPENGMGEPVFQSKYGSSVGDVSHNVNLLNEVEEQFEIKGTIFLLDEDDRSLQEQVGREIWLQDDVVQSFRDFYVQPPEGMSQDDMLQPGQTVIAYISQEQMDRHGRELTEMAESAGIHLILRNQSPRQLRATPVYQRADGTLYADEDSLRFLMNDSSSTTQSVEHTQTINGKTTKKRGSVTISAKMVDALKTVRLVEMDAQNMPLRTTEVSLEDIQALAQQQKPYLAVQDAAYVIVEETYETKARETYVKRTVYSPPKDGQYANLLHTFHFPLENGLTEAASMNIAFR